jgi:hypothetical protein
MAAAIGAHRHTLHSQRVAVKNQKNLHITLNSDIRLSPFLPYTCFVTAQSLYNYSHERKGR